VSEGLAASYFVWFASFCGRGASMEVKAKAGALETKGAKAKGREDIWGCDDESKF
jgi:hypothetical protein